MNDQSRDRGLERTDKQSDLISRLRVGRLPLRSFPEPIWPTIGAALAAVVLLMPWFLRASATPYTTQAVVRGLLVVTVSAKGTLTPRDQVDVGAEISGRVDSIAVDFNDRVRKGQVLARINTDQLQAQLAQARATLDQSEATLRQNEDTITRDRALAKSGAVSPQQLVDAEGDYSRARAGVALASAQVKQDETMLSKATIYAPIDGVVLDRKVSVGQTLVATMQTPVLFTLASDLSLMQLRTEVSEADVGKIHPGDPAVFSVNAYPTRQFSATLASIHDSPQTINGIVAYPGVLLVQNHDGLLKPGMSATVSIEAARVHDGLLVPNRALSYAPPESVKKVAPPLAPSRDGVLWGRVWLLEDRKLVPRDVRLGPSDGKQTAISGGGLKPGDLVVVNTKQS